MRGVRAGDGFQLFPERRWAELALYAVFLIAWLAATTGLRAVLHTRHGVPLLVTGSLPSLLAALATTFLIGGTQGSAAWYAGILAALVSASAELPPLLGLTSGVCDLKDAGAAVIGGALGAFLLAAVRRTWRDVSRG